MKVTAAREFDVFRLLCHDAAREEAADLPFEPFELQEAMNDKLEQLGQGRLGGNEWVQVASPEETGLDRFTVAYSIDRFRDEEPKIFSQKFHSPEEVKESLPPQVVEILEVLNKETFAL